jgi:hypothetical protein
VKRGLEINYKDVSLYLTCLRRISISMLVENNILKAVLEQIKKTAKVQPHTLKLRRNLVH